ncbi:MAG: molybdopterin molybdotransferase MoeA [Planctomycetes bacterium]|nr:molybdopterin molybdotransferase MoeA [Planctomycetota bacterium]
MISLAEARRLVLEHTPSASGCERVPLSAALGRVLCRELRSDVELPPFDKAMMDGFAFRAADASAPGAVLEVIGEARAGAGFAGEVPRGRAVRIMTGAPLPIGLDAVAMIERCELLESGSRVRLAEAARPEQNVARRGVDLRVGEAVAGIGQRLRAAEIAALATVGCALAPVFPALRVHLIGTGDELVPLECRPGPEQIRDTNTPTLAAQLASSAVLARAFPPVRDDESALREAIEAALEGCEVLILTGGVSMGAYDLVGRTLLAAGVREVFHKVAIKPGKPVWFGVLDREGRRQLVFGLPGNPVSTFVTLETLVRPALQKLGGLAPALEFPRAVLGGGHPLRRDAREQFVPARLDLRAVPPRLAPLDYQSSADLVELARADAFAIVPANELPTEGAELGYLPF